MIKSLLKKYEESGTIKEGTRVLFDMFNAYSLDIKVTYFSLVLPLSDYLLQKEAINLEIKSAFEQAGIDMAFPTQEFIMHESPKAKLKESIT